MSSYLHDTSTVGDFLHEHSPDIVTLARAGDMNLITNDLREFERVPGLQVEDWS